MARRDFGVAIGLPEPFTSELQEWRERLGDPNAAGHPAARHPAAADRAARAGARRGRGAPAPVAAGERAFEHAPARLGDLPPGVAGGLRAAGQGARRLRAGRAAGPLGSAAARAEVPVPPARHGGPRPRRAGARPGLRRAWRATRRRFTVWGFTLFEQDRARRLAAAARLPVRRRAGCRARSSRRPRERGAARAERRRVGAAPWRPRRRSWRTLREKRPALDHLIRAFGRYTGRRRRPAGRRGHVLRLPVVLPDPRAGDVGAVVRARRRRRRHGRRAGRRLRPGTGRAARAARRSSAATARPGSPACVGLLGLLYSGLGWVDALREAVRAIWHHNVQEGNFLVKKLKDVVILLGLGATLLVSIGVSAASGAFSGLALELVGLGESVVGDRRDLRARRRRWVCSPAPRSSCSCSGGCRRCSRRSAGSSRARCWPRCCSRCSSGSAPSTSSAPPRTRSTAASPSSSACWSGSTSSRRMLLICAAWTVTAPYDSDIEPSGTANAAAGARRPGIPIEFADNDPDDPPTLQEDGAPSPLAAAVQGQTPSQDVPEGRGSAGEPADRGGRGSRRSRRDDRPGDARRPRAAARPRSCAPRRPHRPRDAARSPAGPRWPCARPRSSPPARWAWASWPCSSTCCGRCATSSGAARRDVLRRRVRGRCAGRPAWRCRDVLRRPRGVAAAQDVRGSGSGGRPCG